MLFPKKVKHRKWQRLRSHPDKRGVSSRGLTVSYGSFGVKTTTHARINSQQIESARRVIKKTIGKLGQVWIRVFPDRPYTQKAAGVKMGKGKGDLKGYEVEVLPGRILFEVEGVGFDTAKEAFRKAGKKLPLKVKMIQRD